MDTTQTLAFRKMLTEAIKKEATDLHLSVGSRPMIRFANVLHPLDGEEVVSERAMKDIVEAIVPHEKRAVLDTKRDVVFVSVFDDKIRAKVHIFYQEQQPSVSIRFLTLVPKTLREMNSPPALDHFASLNEGLLLIGGSQDSGRTTLAAGILEQINRTRAVHIMTIEDPIEYQIVSNTSIVNQREVGSDVGSFEEGLDAALKEDIDVLFVSDLSRVSVLRKALEVASAGVYVIAIMNTDSCSRAIESVIASFPPSEEQYIRTLTGDVLAGVLIQELIPMIGGGTQAVHEVLLNTAVIRTLIVTSRFAQIDTAIKSSRGEGMISFDHALAALARTQKVSLEVARERARDRQTFDALLRA